MRAGRALREQQAGAARWAALSPAEQAWSRAEQEFQAAVSTLDQVRGFVAENAEALGPAGPAAIAKSEALVAERRVRAEAAAAALPADHPSSSKSTGR